MRPLVVVALVSVFAAAIYVWLRLPVVEHVREGYAATCHRVEGSPTDPFCAVTWRAAAWPVLGSAFLAGLGVAVPVAVLTASGRRWLATAPIAPALIALPATAAVRWLLGEAPPSGAWWRFGVVETMVAGWPNDRPFTPGVLGLLIDVALLVSPAVAILVAFRPRAVVRPKIPRGRAVFATFVCGAGVAVVLWASPRLGLLPDVYGAMGGFEGDALTIAGMAVFGAVLGTDRRWWPWILPFVAVLLSGALALLVAGATSSYVTTMGFASALELTAIGLVASAWRPLAIRRRGDLAAPAQPRQADAAPAEPAGVPATAGVVARPVPGASSRRELRPSVILNALAVSVVAISIIAVRNDPLPISISTALPTYLGARMSVQDTAARRTLVEALDAADAYARNAGSYAGFGIRDARQLAPDVSWTRSIPARDLVVTIDAATPDVVRVLTISGTGAAVCMQRDAAGSTTWSERDREGDPASGLAPAAATCGDVPLTPSVLQGLDVASFCDPIADESLLMCRSVQRLMRETLAGTTA